MTQSGLLRNLPAVALICAALGLAALTGVGMVRQFSPVPFWDMWDGAIQFYLQARSGDTDVWWAQHNEHRIVWARVLFWLAFRFSHDPEAVLDGINGLLALAIGLTFARAVQYATPGVRAIDRWALGAALVCWQLLWCQRENLLWGFQSQFLLAQWLPLCALLVLGRDTACSRINRRFMVACALGVAALGAMANGVLALPVMLAHQLAVRAGRMRIAVLAMLALTGLLVYLHGYQQPQSHGSLVQTLTADPRAVLAYSETYLGGPFQGLLRTRPGQRDPSEQAGAILLLTLLALVLMELRRQPRDALRLALLAFSGYIVATAVMTAGGRLVFGVQQAHAGRYATPALMAWAAAFVLVLPLDLLRRHGSVVVSAVLVLLVLLVGPMQKSALARPDESVIVSRDVAALALALHIHDEAQTHALFSDHRVLVALADPAIASHLSVFGSPPLRDIAQTIGQPVPAGVPGKACQGTLQDVTAIPDESGFVRVSGWLPAKVGTRPDTLLALLDAEHRVAGYAVPGFGLSPTQDHGGEAVAHARFLGYLRPAALTGPLHFRLQGDDCPLATLPSAMKHSRSPDEL